MVVDKAGRAVERPTVAALDEQIFEIWCAPMLSSADTAPGRSGVTAKALDADHDPKAPAPKECPRAAIRRVVPLKGWHRIRLRETPRGLTRPGDITTAFHQS